MIDLDRPLGIKDNPTVVVSYKELQELQAESDRRLVLLRRLEWPDYDDKFDDYFCFICDANKQDGHAEGCELAAECHG